MGWSTRGIMANVLDCDILVNEFKLLSRYEVYFRINQRHNDGFNNVDPKPSRQSILSIC